jgi:hypothetical protein
MQGVHCGRPRGGGLEGGGLGGGGDWPISIFFEIRFKIKWLEKECIFQNFDQNKVHFNQNLGSKSSRFQSKASGGYLPAGS